MKTPLFHVGVVVPDIEAARARFTEILGVAWGPMVEAEVHVRDGDGKEHRFPNRLCYSTEQPYIELIQEVPGSVWTCNEHSNLHHIGFYSDAVFDESGRLTSAQCALEYLRVTDNPLAAFAYHRDPLGVRIELVSSAMQASMAQSLTRARDA
jgi:catechol 2,3-dioxygenase-like lactoylglutathione lyase family enzyme